MLVKKKIIILGIVTIVLVIAVGIGLFFYNKEETDYVFEGTFVNSEINVPNSCDLVASETEHSEIVNEYEDENADPSDEDCFKRSNNNCYFV